MLIDYLPNAERYCPIHPGLAGGFAFLRRADLAQLPDGRHEIDAERVFAVVSRGQGRGREQSLLEAHRRYLDIQLVLQGAETISWAPLRTLRPKESYSVEKDLVFLDGPEAGSVTLQQGWFALFYPEDAHKPCCHPGRPADVLFK